MAAAPDAEFERIRPAFDAALMRMCAAPTQGELHDELSNVLHHLYRLAELCKHRRNLTSKTFYGKNGPLTASNDLRAARAIAWVRKFDTHDTAVVAAPGDVYSNFYTMMYGVLVWKPLAQLPEQIDSAGHDRHLDYENQLKDPVTGARLPVLDTIRRAFDAMAALL
jgi:hypothetical protein